MSYIYWYGYILILYCFKTKVGHLNGRRVFSTNSAGITGCPQAEDWSWTSTSHHTQKLTQGTSLVAQWLGVRLPMQRTRVWALVREDSTCRRAAKPVSHNYWARLPQLLRPVRLEPVLRSGRGHCNEKPVHHNEEWPLLPATREKPVRSNEDPMQPKI